MMTKSIERAQKKVEKTTLVFVNVCWNMMIMNAQREVIYKRRRHALFGERLKLDIANMLYDTCELIIQDNKELMISKL
jgi:preprotein translocase subunit SecA